MASKSKNIDRGARPKVKSEEDQKNTNSQNNGIDQRNGNVKKEILKSKKLEDKEKFKTALGKNGSMLKSQKASPTLKQKVMKSEKKLGDTKSRHLDDVSFSDKVEKPVENKYTGLFQRWKNSGLALKNYLHKKSSKDKVQTKNVTCRQTKENEAVGGTSKKHESLDDVFSCSVAKQVSRDSYSPYKYMTKSDSKEYFEDDEEKSEDFADIKNSTRTCVDLGEVLNALQALPSKFDHKSNLNSENNDHSVKQNSLLYSEKKLLNCDKESHSHVLGDDIEKDLGSSFLRLNIQNGEDTGGKKKDSETLENFQKDFCDSDLENKLQVTYPLNVHSSKLIHKLKCKNEEILKKSTSLSSDSGNTDTSSVCEWADGSSDAYKVSYHSNNLSENGSQDSHVHVHSKNGKQFGFSPKRYRKRTPSRAKSVENDDISNSRKSLNGHKISISSDSSDSQSEPSASSNNLVNYKRRRIGSQMSEESTESETLSCDIIDKFDVTDLKSSSESPREAIRTAENDHKHVLANLKYAIPYLSDKLKASLANRLTKEENSSNLDYLGDKHEKLKSDDTDKKILTGNTNRTSSCENNDSDFICNGSPSLEKDFSLSDSQGFDKTSELSNQDDSVFDSRPSLSMMLAGFDDTWEDGGIGFYGNHSDSSDDEVVNHLESDHESAESDGPDALPLFNLDESSDSGEADDEFECECDHCQLIRSQRRSENHREMTGLQSISNNGRIEDDSHRPELWSTWLPDVDDEEGLYRINIEELSPLDLLMNDRRNELELMFENVILQMLAVHPDLLSDHAPPPASTRIIENLPNITVTVEHLDQGLSCPICLCPCEKEETVSQLPCQHLFHPLCVQAWLKKSGTCPVCRHAL